MVASGVLLPIRVLHPELFKHFLEGASVSNALHELKYVVKAQRDALLTARGRQGNEQL